MDRILESGGARGLWFKAIVSGANLQIQRSSLNRVCGNNREVLMGSSEVCQANEGTPRAPHCLPSAIFCSITINPRKDTVPHFLRAPSQ